MSAHWRPEFGPLHPWLWGNKMDKIWNSIFGRFITEIKWALHLISPKSLSVNHSGLLGKIQAASFVHSGVLAFSMSGSEAEL